MKHKRSYQHPAKRHWWVVPAPMKPTVRMDMTPPQPPPFTNNTEDDSEDDAVSDDDFQNPGVCVDDLESRIDTLPSHMNSSRTNTERQALGRATLVDYSSSSDDEEKIEITTETVVERQSQEKTRPSPRRLTRADLKLKRKQVKHSPVQHTSTAREQQKQPVDCNEVLHTSTASSSYTPITEPITPEPRDPSVIQLATLPSPIHAVRRLFPTTQPPPTPQNPQRKSHKRKRLRESKGSFLCQDCPKRFTWPFNLKTHIKQVHKAEKPHICEFCFKSFARHYNLQRHTRVCSFSMKRSAKLIRMDNNNDDVEELVGACNDVVPNAVSQPEHMEVSLDNGDDSNYNERVLLQDPVQTASGMNNNVPPIIQPTQTAENVDDIRKMLEQHRKAIQDNTCKGKVQDRYNFDLNSPVEPRLRNLFSSIPNVSRLNGSYGFILRNIENGEMRFYHPSGNNSRILDEPRLIRDVADFNLFVEDITHNDIVEWARQHRPDSKWIVEKVTNLTIYVNKLRDHPIGAPVVLPTYVLRNKGLHALIRNERGSEYKDNLCLFRCLALFYGKNVQNLEATAKTLYRQYTPTPIGKFDGVTYVDLPTVEKMFKLNIDVYSLEEKPTNDEDSTIETVARLVRRSTCRYPSTMKINQYGDHFSYIYDMKTYSHSFACQHCGKLWKTSNLMRRHEVTCTAEIHHSFPGGVYHTPQNVFELLDEEGINVPENLRYYCYRATYDFESYFTQESEGNGKLQWDAAHIPLSVSVASNVPGYESAVCFVTDGDTQSLVNKMTDYLHAIAKKAEKHINGQLQPYKNKIWEKIRDLTSHNPVLSLEEELKKLPLFKLLKKLEVYSAQMPVIGFNSGKYDINLVKTALMKALSTSVKYVVKRDNSFLCIATDRFKFIDIINYLAPGYSYDNFLKAYNCSTTKGHLPYEWLDSLDKLNYTALPEHAAFFSKLKNENISNDEYEGCCTVWRENNTQTFRDYLIWYNNLDVAPFLEAIEKQFSFYKNLGIDMFKDGISVPGLTLKYLFSTLNENQCFALIGEKNKDLYHTIKRNIVGGPSIIFHRHHEKGLTKIRERDFQMNAKLCESVIGYDANALYLWALMQHMPTGAYTRREAKDGFKPHKSHKHGWMAAEWMAWEMYEKNVYIRHMFNHGEKKIGPRQLPVDGYCQENNTCYEFQGCYYHLHDCIDTDVNEISGKTKIELQASMEEKKQYIKDMGYNLEIVWECEWKQMKKNRPEIRDFVKQQSSPVLKLKTQEDILDAVRADKFFGLVECDINVPEKLKDYFSEMPPIFKNVEVAKTDIGDVMRAYAENNNIMKRPQRMLISSFFGEKILLATPLLKWYLEKGLKVSTIHQIVEYHPDACFVKFGNIVSDARRSGDVDSSKAIIANTMKLLGNSGYGKTVTDKERHVDIKYCSERTVDRYINDKRFRKLNQLADDFYEVEMSKHTIKFDLPYHIGFFVYQYAKLRMLQFHYDFVDKYVPRTNYQLCEMDTDSLYLALSTSTLDEAVANDKRPEFYREKNNWLMTEACNRHMAEYIRTKLSGEKWSMERDCCIKARAYELRQAGKFKTEFEDGVAFIGLNSKTYYCVGAKDKYSTKGLSKRHNHVDKDMFLNVIKTQQSRGGINRGFRLRNNRMHTYTQQKNALTFFYPKRIVLDDGVTTLPLAI